MMQGLSNKRTGATTPNFFFPSLTNNANETFMVSPKVEEPKWDFPKGRHNPTFNNTRRMIRDARGKEIGYGITKHTALLFIHKSSINLSGNPMFSFSHITPSEKVTHKLKVLSLVSLHILFKSET